MNPRRDCEELADRRRGIEDVLEVIGDDQRFTVAEIAQSAHTDRPRNRAFDETGIADLGERHEEDAAGEVLDELGGDLEGEPGLAASPRSGQRHQARAVTKHPGQVGKLPLSPYERVRGHGQVGCVQRPQRRKVPVAELVDPLGCRQVLEPILPEVAQTLHAGQVPSRLRDQDLAAVAGGGDAGRTVDVDPDVALLGHKRLAGVQSHPHPNGTALEFVARVCRSRKCVRRLPEGDEECVALRVDLDAPVPREGSAEYATMLGKQAGIAGAVLLQQPRRALDVREEERDRALRQRSHRVGASGGGGAPSAASARRRSRRRRSARR